VDDESMQLGIEVDDDHPDGEDSAEEWGD